MKKKVFVFIWLAGLALAAAKYPPGQRWQEIERNGFTIIFPASRWAEAMYALAAAEASSEKLSAFWRFRLPGRVRIVLSDATDQPNGFATFYPFNLVGADLAEPPPDSELASRFGSLDLVLDHELTHLFTMNAGSPPLRAARRIFGSLPLLYPAVQLPAWVSEGLAVYCESAFRGDGRLNNPPYRLMLNAARRDGRFPDWSGINGLPAAWPGPSAKYLYGGGFMQYVADKYGADSLRQYLEWSTSLPVIFSSSRDFQKTFGKPLDKLWEEYRTNSGDPPAGPTPEPLTDSGFLHLYPTPLPGGRLAYYHRDYRSRGTIEILEPGERRGKTLLRMDAVDGLGFAASENKIYLSATERYHAFGEYSDLYEYEMSTGRRRRLSRGQRLFQPVKNENATALYCVQRRDGRYYLARFDMETGQAHAISLPFVGMAQPAISPDGTMVAAAVKPAHEPWGIAIFSQSGQLRAFRTIPGDNLSQPRWQNNQTVLFILSGEESTTLASFSLAGDPGGFYRDPRLEGLQQFALSANGREIFFTYYSGRGREIAKLTLADLGFTPAEVTQAAEISGAGPYVPAAPGRPYRFWRDLLPRWWAPVWRLTGDEFQAGIITSGQDSLGIHSYSLESYYGFSSHRLNYSFSYTYDGLFPTLSLSYSDNSDHYHTASHSLRSQELKLASWWPIRLRRRSQLYGYADLHLERRTVISELSTDRCPSSYNGFRLGLDFNSAREYYDSISAADGMRLTLQYSLQPAGLANGFASRSAQADLRSYIALFRPGVLAWRLALARSWGAGASDYALGGGKGVAGNGLGNNRLFGLLRAFPAGFQYGDRGLIFNLEYRVPLFKTEKALLPAVSLDRVYLNAFIDMGRLWQDSYKEQAAYAVGGEMALRLAFGAAAAYDISFGAAFSLAPGQYWRIYLRSGRSF